MIDLPLRASNEGSPRPRVARAQKILRPHPLPCSASTEDHQSPSLPPTPLCTASNLRPQTSNNLPPSTSLRVASTLHPHPSNIPHASNLKPLTSNVSQHASTSLRVASTPHPQTSNIPTPQPFLMSPQTSNLQRAPKGAQN